MNEFLPNFLPQLTQQLINGLSLGSIYALIAIGYTMVYGIIGMINFAHGEIYMIGAYVGVVTLTALGAASGTLPLTLVLAGALVAAIVVTAAYGWTVERVAYRPLRGGPRLVPLISAIGMSIFLQNYVQLGQGARDVSVPPLLPGNLFSVEIGGFPVSLSVTRALIIGVTVVLMIALTLYIGRSRMGRACRACSEDMGMARLLGIDTDRVISFTFVLGAALAAVGGVLIGLSIGKINPFIGFVVGVKAFTAAVLGGIGSIPGAMLGGVLLGLTETFASAFLPTEYKDVVAFSLLVLVLLFRPTGLLGKPDIEKV
ncbi:MAG TPA: high-affinity branched-chain amino acid ABC transporter permease LivH [Plasticicumulans sp.]|uniref:high-affinity branched-chain amino acid ABC transporter permease LivH n=2 Tax=Plasticicumulans sp. TaxID=2307179 RepID=UPI000F98F1DA|nr:high-affinity branched-chain amino acid ABC transporter permease LivH [Plasticicumulans sp.]MBS0600797.1 high-affinity branched-chain amino acid ABC transporter permease LivH [Pseudomonadota bacterium]RTK96502.1 MAG: high-affinity branched-chain amino acid ABC transporter permease LivH [Xanthomonadales bacterium]HMV39760.1 high-affinity branched-chain amino acid ABC transporter permease LivH [Plasticicumulans sp.]HMW28975.1 high-affinity branched-chain amino acid ABC transporter permease Liv